MEKFSLYDFLGLLLPGVLFVYITHLIFNMIGIDLSQFTTTEWLLDIGLAFCLAIFAGAVFYSGNFYLIKKKWYNRLFGMYVDVTTLFKSYKVLYENLRPILNLKAKKWYGVEIFQSLSLKNDAKDTSKDLTDDLQDDFYDRMYYELEYHEKIESPKTMQSFYFFFRQTALACALLIIIIAIIIVLNFLKLIDLAVPSKDMFVLAFLISIMLLISVTLARWCRKRMVLKMYWMFFTHINNSK